jgi:hypothetical protein
MTTNEELMSNYERQRSLELVMTECIRHRMLRIPACRLLRHISGALTGTKMPLAEAKGIVDKAYALHFQQIVTEYMPRALRERNVRRISELNAELTWFRDELKYPGE